MKCVYECDIGKKVEMLKILEANPYGTENEKKSFSRLGYKLKEGVQVGADTKKLYVFFRGADDYESFIKNNLKDIAKQSEKSTEEKIINSIEEEEAGAEKGMGSLFGD